MRVRFSTAAAADLSEAITRYEGISTGLGDQLLDQVDLTVDRLQVFPHGAPPVEGLPGVRRARVRRFPYGIFYRVQRDELIVLRNSTPAEQATRSRTADAHPLLAPDPGGR